MTVDRESEALSSYIGLDKGKPPLIQPYDGPNAEVYLTPEYLRGRASAELVKPAPNAVRVADGETIVLWDGSNAGEIFRAKQGILASTMTRIRANGHFQSEYFYYALKVWEDYLKGQTSGSGIPHVDKEVLGKLTVLACDPDEQSKVAEILSTVDRAIDQTEALIAKQQRIKTGLMQDLLTRGIDEQGNLRSEETHQFKDSPLGRIPEDWDVQPLKDCSKRVVVGLASSTTHAYRTSGVPMIRNQNIRMGYFEDHDMLFLDPVFANAFPNKAARTGDVLTVRTGSNVGDTAKVPAKYVGSPTFTTLITSPNPKHLNSDFMVWYVASEFGEKERNRIMVGGGKENLNVGQFVNFRIALPPIDEQKLIVDRLNASQVEIRSNELIVAKIRRLKTALMQDLLTGENRVTPLLEPAVTT